MNLDDIFIRPAYHQDHKEIVALAKRSKYTSDFSNAVMFSSERAYDNGWIKVAEKLEETANGRLQSGPIVAFTCVRHKTRVPETVLYFVQVAEEYRSLRLGEIMLDEVMRTGPHKTMRLNVMKDNERAIKFYERLGFAIVGEAIGGNAVAMTKEYP